MDKNKIVECIQNNKYYPNNEDLFASVLDRVEIKMRDVCESITDNILLEKLLKRTVSKTFREVLVEWNRLEVHETKKLDNDLVLEIEKKCSINVLSDVMLRQVYKCINEQNDEEDANILSKIFELKYKENRSFSEIAEVLEMTEEELTAKMFEMSDLVNRIAKNELSKV